MMDNKERKDDLGNIDEFNEKYRHYVSDAEAEESDMVNEDAETVRLDKDEEYDLYDESSDTDEEYSDEQPDEPKKKQNFFTKTKHRNSKIIALCLVIVLLLGIGAGLVWIYVSTKSEGYGDDGIDYGTIDKNYLVDDNTQFKVMGDIDADSLNAFLYEWANSL